MDVTNTHSTESQGTRSVPMYHAFHFLSLELSTSMSCHIKLYILSSGFVVKLFFYSFSVWGCKIFIKCEQIYHPKGLRREMTFLQVFLIFLIKSSSYSSLSSSSEYLHHPL